MALAFEVESLEGVEDSAKALYIEKDGKFRLDLTGFDPADELKEALRKERELNKDEKQKRHDLEEAKRLDDLKRAQEKGEFKTLYESTIAALDNERATNSEFKKKIEQKELDTAALKVAGQLTKDTSRSGLLVKEILQYTKYNDGEIQYEIDGVVVDSKVLSDKITSDYPFLVDGNQSSGGGAGGGKGGGAASKVKTRAEFDALSHADRSKFSLDGGKVTD